MGRIIYTEEEKEVLRRVWKILFKYLDKYIDKDKNSPGSSNTAHAPSPHSPKSSFHSAMDDPFPPSKTDTNCRRTK